MLERLARGAARSSGAAVRDVAARGRFRRARAIAGPGARGPARWRVRSGADRRGQPRPLACSALRAARIPERLRIVAVAEPDDAQRARRSPREHGLAAERGASPTGASCSPRRALRRRRDRRDRRHAARRARARGARGAATTCCSRSRSRRRPPSACASSRRRRRAGGCSRSATCCATPRSTSSVHEIVGERRARRARARST